MIKVPYEDCLRFIENYLHIELFDFQRTLLRHICDGEIIYGGRGCGRSTVVKGYIEYLSRLLDEHCYDAKSNKMISYPKGAGYCGKSYIDEEPLVVFKNGSWIKMKR